MKINVRYISIKKHKTSDLAKLEFTGGIEHFYNIFFWNKKVDGNWFPSTLNFVPKFPSQFLMGFLKF